MNDNMFWLHVGKDVKINTERPRSVNVRIRNHNDQFDYQKYDNVDKNGCLQFRS